MKVSRLVVSLFMLAAFLGATAFSQNSGAPTPAAVPAAVTGTVSDQTGAGVNGATITLSNGSSSSPSATTDDQGLYAVTDLVAGAYTVSVSVHGVNIFQGSIVLSSGQVLTLSVAGAPVAQTPLKQATAAAPATPPPPAASTPPSSAASSPAAAAPPASATAAPAPAPAPSTARTTNSAPPAAATPAASVPVPPPAAATVATTPAQSPAVASAPVKQSQPPSSPAPAAAPETVPAASVGVVAAGSIGGAVNDQTGAALVGATVKITNAAGETHTATSDDKGNYVVKGLSPGSYKLTVTVPGFKTFEADNLVLPAGEGLPLDASLEPAGEHTEVNVEGQKVAEVETDNAQVSGTITEKEVLSLGLNGRNFTQLVALTPGVSNQTGQDEAKVGVTGSVKYSVNGGRVEYNTFEVDGSDVLNAGLNGAESTLVVYPSLDAIQEVKVLTSNYGAQYGRTASGTVMVTTKSGGPAWHGSGYEFFRNEAFNARNYFDQSKKAPLYRRNDFGFTIGGPVFIPGTYNTKKDKTFVFWSEEFRYEKSPTDQQPDFNRGVPSLAERNGDFNDVCPALNDPSGPAPGVFSRARWPDCPSAGTAGQFSGYQLAFPNNDIGELNAFGTLDPNALALLNTNLIPLPNAAGGCNSSIGSCYNAVISEPTYWREELVNLDHNINASNRLSLRFIHDAWNTTVPVPQWQHLPGNVVNSFPTVQNKFVGPGTNVSAHLTQTITPSLLNVFTAAFTNSHITLSNVNGPGGADAARPSGLGSPGGDCSTLPAGSTSCPLGAIFSNGFGGKAPGIIIAGNNQEYGGNGFGADTSYMPWDHTNPAYSLRDDISKVIRSHTLQFGAEFVIAQRNQTNGSGTGGASGDVQGLLTFSNINGGGQNTGNAFANFLTLFTTGNANAIQSYTQDSTQSRYYNRYRIGEPYIQDDWKVTSRLTLNLGVRFSLFGLYHEKNSREYNWDRAAYSPQLASQLMVDPGSGQLIGLPEMMPIPVNVGSPDPRLMNGLVQCGANRVPAGCMTGHIFNPAPRIGVAWDPFGNGKTSIRAGYGMFYEHGTGEEANTGSLEASAPFILSMTQQFPQNYGCIGGSSAGCAVMPGAYPLNNVVSIPTKVTWPYAQQWSLSIERQLPKSLVATVAYVGSKGTHLTVERQVNQLKPLPAALNPFGPNQPLIPQATVAGPGDCGGYVVPAPGVPGSFHLLNGTTVGPQDPAYINLEAACTGENTQNATPNVNTLRPYPGLAEIFSLQNVANSDYHALQATIRRTQGPLTIGASYSFSHSIDNSSDTSDATFVNSYDLASNRANSNFDQRHLLSVSYVIKVPDMSRLLQRWQASNPDDTSDAGQDKASSASSSQLSSGDPGRFLRILGDGWGLSGITVYQSGTPFSVINGGSSTVSVLDNAGVANGIGIGSYPDVVGDPHAAPPTAGDNARSFGPLLGNPNAFAAPRGLTFGDAGRNFLNNPGRLNFDMSILKHFPIHESGTLEFRAEAFNIFNHTQFRIYDPNLGNTGTNVISCYGGPSYTAGYSAPGGVDCLTGSSFLHPVDAHRPRTMQLGLKYLF